MTAPTLADLRASHPVEADMDAVLTRKLARRGTVVHDPSALDGIRDRLESWLSTKLDAPFTLGHLGRLTGGASKEQFLFDLTWIQDGAERTDRMVLRMNPPASVVETSRTREFEALQALRGTLPVPEVFWVTEDPADLGEPGLVCGFVEGAASPTGAPKTASGLGTTYGDRLRPVLAQQFVEHLAALHTFDWTTHELPSFQRPEAGTTQALDWRLGYWDRAWAEDAVEPHPVVVLTQQWLWENRPPVDHVSLVHGDYRNGNFMFHEDSGQMTAVLDWELAFLGDRHHDLAYLMTQAWGQVDEQTGDFYCSALITRDELIREYERLSGLTVDPVRLHYYTVLNMYWLVVACSATGPRVAAERMTHLDVMMNFLSGLGAWGQDQLLQLVTGPVR